MKLKLYPKNLGQYTYLLISLVFVLLCFSISIEKEIWKFVVHMWMLLSVFAMIFSLKANRIYRLVAYLLGSLTVLFLACSFICVYFDLDTTLTLLYIYIFPLTIVYYFFSAWAIVHAVFSSKQVTADILSGAIVAYMLMGLAWCGLYCYLEFLNPGSFEFGKEIPIEERPSELLYYSYVTLTTLGYGDILPLSRLARTLAYLEAIVGVMYSAIIVAFLVSNFQKKTD